MAKPALTKKNAEKEIRALILERDGRAQSVNAVLARLRSKFPSQVDPIIDLQGDIWKDAFNDRGPFRTTDGSGFIKLA